MFQKMKEISEKPLFSKDEGNPIIGWKPKHDPDPLKSQIPVVKRFFLSSPIC